MIMDVEAHEIQVGDQILQPLVVKKITVDDKENLLLEIDDGTMRGRVLMFDPLQTVTINTRR